MRSIPIDVWCRPRVESFSRRVLLSDAQGRKQKPNRRLRCLGIASVSEERKKRKQESDSKGVLFSLDFRGHIEVR
jgi:hypothetical protein